MWKQSPEDRAEELCSQRKCHLQMSCHKEFYLIGYRDGFIAGGKAALNVLQDVIERNKDNDPQIVELVNKHFKDLLV